MLLNLKFRKYNYNLLKFQNNTALDMRNTFSPYLALRTVLNVNIYIRPLLS